MALVHRIHRKQRISKIKRTPFDKFVDIAAFIYPVVGIPQVIRVFEGDSSGVSMAYWLGTGAYSVLFLVYGIKHKVEPMIIIYGLWVIINALVITGLLING